ncbi:LacI family DNA-binding transcriptional regulator [Limimaricola pyoseonensis]|uniref:Transcriptional regulator, LacI family n=1 Tax=Limimaricola pyoseonensis TaxID=521013 RepID=A0A1G7HND4_9RHOB|nr:LacI family DNA-binding transcriptional regulator [Limimaricola pyoseonensis]SDF01519.1 transcriptional regulator, LacI family [Limimaricola pyoseonensis]
MPDRSQRRITILDVAREAGVSKSTVSLVLRGSSLVNAETRDRVEAAAERIGYVYNRGAAALRSATSSFVALVIPDLVNPFFAQLAVAVEEALSARGFVPLLANTNDSPNRQRDLMRSMREHGAAGVMISPAQGTPPEDLAGLGLPIVTMMRRPASAPDPALPYVGPDNADGARRIAAHLHGLGHRRLAFLGGTTGMSTQHERLSGLRAGLAAAGLDPDRAVTVHDALPSRSGGHAAALEVLAAAREGDRPTAFVGYNDIVAFGAGGALRAQGLRIGRDIALTGFDNVAETAHHAPPLTTVDVRIDDLGRAAAAALLARIGGEAVPPETILPTRLVVRESCGAPGAGATEPVRPS